MAEADLLFSLLPGTANLLFGESSVAPDVSLSIAGTFPPLEMAFEAIYRSDTSRPIVNRAATAWDTAERMREGAQDRASTALPVAAAGMVPWEVAAPLAARVASLIPDSFDPAPVRWVAGHQDAARVAADDRRVVSEEALRDRRISRAARFEGAAGLRHSRGSRFEDGDRRPRNGPRSRYQRAVRVSAARRATYQFAVPFPIGWQSWWGEAIRPPAGRFQHPTEPEEPGCYTPSGALIFKDAIALNGVLLFVCERTVPPEPGETVIVPIRRVYVVVNDVRLRRVAGNIDIPTLSLGLKIDADSWTWGFDATVPAEALGDLEPDASGIPVELEVTINGTAYRVLAERLSRERAFGEASVKVTGRGKGAVLDAPYAPTKNFSNTANRTAQQLMADALQVNGVPIGWSVDWGITDWLVPAGVWSHQGTYISALNAIAEAAGAYLQPHRTAQTIRVLPRYPAPPWEWGSVVPGFVLPSAATARESLEWKDAARYNGVYVSGVSAGVLGWVKRTGTAGDELAPMVVDPLITEAVAARQRGIAVLADTGRQIQVTLRLPVLPETGVIEPGVFVEYQDGGVSRLGLVRSTSVQAGLPEVWQTLGVESHA